MRLTSLTKHTLSALLSATIALLPVVACASADEVAPHDPGVVVTDKTAQAQGGELDIAPAETIGDQENVEASAGDAQTLSVSKESEADGNEDAAIAVVSDGGLSATSDGDSTVASLKASSEDVADEVEVALPKISTRVYRSDGWTKSWASNGSTAGTEGGSKVIGAVRAKISMEGTTGGIRYRVRLKGKGWQPWAKNGAQAGKKSKSTYVEAVQMKLTGTVASLFDLYYRTYVKGVGWLGWASAGKTSGSIKLTRGIVAMQTAVVRAGEAAPSDEGAASTSPYLGKLSVSYSSYVTSTGWQSARRNGAVSGTTKKSRRMECVRVSLSDAAQGSVAYRVCTGSQVWSSWSTNGEDAGVAGSGERIEAVKVKLKGAASKVYNVWYRVRVYGYGWLGWTKGGKAAGVTGTSQSVQAIQIKVLRKSSKAPGSTDRSYLDGTLRTCLEHAQGARKLTGFGGYVLKSTAKKKLSSAISGLRGSGYDVGFIMMDVSTKQGVCYNCDKVFYGASSIKAPYIASVVSKYPSALTRYKHNITETLTYSWDYDYKQVFYGYGKDPMRTWCAESGARASIAESLPWADYSARDLALLWAQNYKLFTSTSAGKTLGSWCEHPETSTIHTTLGGKYRTQSKAGWIAAGGKYMVSDDGGIVYATNGTYVIAIMSSVPANHDRLNTLTAAIDYAHSVM